MPRDQRRFAINDHVKCLHLNNTCGVIKCFSRAEDGTILEVGLMMDDPNFRGHTLNGQIPDISRRGWYVSPQDMALVVPSENRQECNEYAPYDAPEDEYDEIYEPEEFEPLDDGGWTERPLCHCNRCTEARRARGESD